MSTSLVTVKTPGKAANTIGWCLQILTAIAFLGAGGSKLAGVPQMVAVFQTVGIGQWLRYMTGALEIVGAVLLLIPALCDLGALLLSSVMMGAIFTHLFKIGGNPIPPIVLLIFNLAILWLRRDRLTRRISRGRV